MGARSAVNRHSMLEKTNPDTVQGTFQARGSPSRRKLPNVGTGQLLPLMENLSHCPDLSHEL
jgi:hypothetical protein